MAVNDVYKVTYWWRLHGQMCCYVWHFKAISGAASAAQLLPFFQIGGSLYSSVLNRHSVEAQSVYVEARRITLGLPDNDMKPFNPADKGTALGVCLPSHIANCMTFYTGSRHRSKRGRMYWGAISSAWVSNSMLTQGAISQYNAFRDQWLGFFGPNGTSANWRLGVWSRELGGPDGFANVIGWTQVTSMFFPNLISHNRKRKVGVGM